MSRQIYYTSRAIPFLGFLFLLAPIPVIAFLDNVSLFDPMIFTALIVIGILWLQLSFGIYIVIDDDSIHSVGYPFIHRRLPYRMIKRVSLQGIPAFANSVRMLFVEANLKDPSSVFTDKSGMYRIGNDAQYDPEVISAVIKSIQQRAPHAKIDPLAQAFVEIVDSKKLKGSISFETLKEEAAKATAHK